MNFLNDTIFLWRFTAYLILLSLTWKISSFYLSLNITCKLYLHKYLCMNIWLASSVCGCSLPLETWRRFWRKRCSCRGDITIQNKNLLQDDTIFIFRDKAKFTIRVRHNITWRNVSSLLCVGIFFKKCTIAQRLRTLL